MNRLFVILITTAIYILYFTHSVQNFESSPTPIENELYQAIATGELMRLHVIANSDSTSDQQLKLNVRDALISEYGERIAALGERDINELYSWVEKNIAAIENTAQKAAALEGYTGSIKAVFEKTAFPERDYAGVRVPAGEYIALCVLIGNAEGRNWWCVMFPPLCFPQTSPQEEAASPIINTDISSDAAEANENTDDTRITYDSETSQKINNSNKIQFTSFFAEQIYSWIDSRHINAGKCAD